MKIAAYKLSIQDWNIDIRPIDHPTVSRYAGALRSGEVLPPLVVDKDTNEVVDGKHRLLAHMKAFGDCCNVEIESHRFDSRKEKLKIMAAKNSRHGLPLTGFSRNKMIVALIGEGAAVEEIKEVLGIQCDIYKLLDRVMVSVGREDTGRVVKAAAFDNLPSHLTDKQYEEHRSKDMGVPSVRLVEQLIRQLINGSADVEKPANRVKYLELLGILKHIFGS